MVVIVERQKSKALPKKSMTKKQYASVAAGMRTRADLLAGRLALAREEVRRSYLALLEASEVASRAKNYQAGTYFHEQALRNRRLLGIDK